MAGSQVLTVKKPGAGRSSSAIRVNGARQAGYFVPYALFRGGQLEVITKRTN